MENLIIIAVLILILGFAGFYIYKAKKSGKKCIGCPNSCSCGENGKNTNCGCNISK